MTTTLERQQAMAAADAKSAETMRAERVQNFLVQKDALKRVRSRWAAVATRVA